MKQLILPLFRLVFHILWYMVQGFSLKLSRFLFIEALAGGLFAESKQVSPLLQTTLFGRKLPTPIGLGSDFDYVGEVLDYLKPLGVSFGEFGSYTRNRDAYITIKKMMDKHQAIFIQHKGIENPGVNVAVKMLTSRRHRPMLTGVALASFGLEEMQERRGGDIYNNIEEFRQMTLQVAPYADYIVLNLSHPSMSLAQMISDETTIGPLILSVKGAIETAAPLLKPKVALKVPYDMSDLEIKTLTPALINTQLDAIIVAGGASTNRGIRTVVSGLPNYQEDMGSILVGKPLHKGVLRLVKRFYIETRGRIPIIASGGVFSGQDAYDLIEAGATAVEIGSVFYFKGPNAVRLINRELVELLKKNKMANITALIGQGSQEAMKKEIEQEEKRIKDMQDSSLSDYVEPKQSHEGEDTRLRSQLDSRDDWLLARES